jgi:hypothetical protein
MERIRSIFLSVCPSHSKMVVRVVSMFRSAVLSPKIKRRNQRAEEKYTQLHIIITSILNSLYIEVDPLRAVGAAIY